MQRKNTPKKIHIIGSVGSGKTTLARELSLLLNIPYYELDNVVWKRYKTGDIRRTETERDTYLTSIVHTESWIIEGVHNEDWVSPSFQNAQLIIFLDTKNSARIYRIIKRFVFQKLGIEKSNYTPTFKIFLKMFKWNRHFEQVGKPDFFNKYGQYNDKFIIINHKKSLKNFLILKS
ncbi:DNA topology modulation protein FlaR [Bacillus sp. MUM 13]|uniref:DNA topology modulation protein FlaR n=1 Tax=Bacillus sp. MUM 13 TaxID=1678001 RepID=UPI0008F5770A|nr:DNA topology modulation protein FlaR [Bacillus sp. MUM 13]OIK10571.1 DNA topology modulation protein FlaR [Bacillus sp. MUM 13]